ncbi:hypothetical protein B0H19DRAFT_1370950 [Mycena capillaripes]|nr:hypothetical protein B0H19DRAFT_1370950 [Mycena capillaripes]
MNADPILLKEGIRTIGTAGVAGRVSSTPKIPVHTDPALWPNSEDLATEHPISHHLMPILETYKRLYKETGGTSLYSSRPFISVQEVGMACGEMEMHHATIDLLKVDMTRPYADARASRRSPTATH